MRIIACRFQRSKDVDEENGVAIVDDAGNPQTVIDAKATYVPDLWDLKLLYHLLNLPYKL